MPEIREVHAYSNSSVIVFFVDNHIEAKIVRKDHPDVMEFTRKNKIIEDFQ